MFILLDVVHHWEWKQHHQEIEELDRILLDSIRVISPDLLFLNKQFDHEWNQNQEFFDESKGDCRRGLNDWLLGFTRPMYSRIFFASSERNKCQSAPGRSPFLKRCNWASSIFDSRISASTSAKKRRRRRLLVYSIPVLLRRISSSLSDPSSPCPPIPT